MVYIRLGGKHMNKTEIFENDETYIVETYESGATVKYLKPIEENFDVEEKKLSDIEQATLDTALNVEYLVCLSELNV